MQTTLLTNARVICPKQNIDRIMNLYICDGRIAELDSDRTTANLVIDCTGLIATTGFVDMHVHLRDPGQTHKEDIITGCNAAAAGGVTSVLAMPNTTPAIDNSEVIEYILGKAQNVNAKVYVAASITKGLCGTELTDFETLKNAGAIAFTDDGRPVENTKFMGEALKFATQNNMSVVSHCEDLYLAKNGKINQGEVSAKLGVAGIPREAEDCATAREIALAAATNTKVHICHISTLGSVALVRDAKRRGVRVTGETAPHYIALTDKALLGRNADFRMNPPLRTEQDRLAIIEGLCDGTIDAIATDHAPHTAEEKADFEKAPNGSIGMETSFAVCNTYLVQTGKMTINELIRKMSYNPSQILGINAGTLEVGSNADIAIINPNLVWTVDKNKLHGKSTNTPFDNAQLTGKVVCTLLDGKVVYNDMNI